MALVLSTGCAGAREEARPREDALLSELRALRQENQDLARRVDALSARVDYLARQARAAPAAPAAPAAEGARTEPEPAPLVPENLAVVKVAPPSQRARSAPPVPTSVPIAEPAPERLEALQVPSRRELAAEAEAALRAARRKDGLARAHAFEDFTARYPNHAGADNALVVAAEAYEASGRSEAACTLARRALAEYPAGDAASDALWVLAACEARRGDAGAERRLLARIVEEYPRSPAAERAGGRLASISGQPDGGTGPARSGP